MEVANLIFGTVPIGSISGDIQDEVADAISQAARDSGIRHYDSSPVYGCGLAELRSGSSLRLTQRDDFVLLSNFGRRFFPCKREKSISRPTIAAAFRMVFGYSNGGTKRKSENSLRLLALASMEICLIRGIGRFTQGNDRPKNFEQAMSRMPTRIEKLKRRSHRCNVKAIDAQVDELDFGQKALELHNFDRFRQSGTIRTFRAGVP